ncbi:helix-turn-helix domain-containing protein [Streptomyces lavendulae]|uniref:helix-turn-helix domain-containing protein n=1 Tax=Streptomyces lavendulae TaxID=1914 RepID=UPI0037151093
MQTEDEILARWNHLLTSKEAAQMVHVSPGCIRKWVARGYLRQVAIYKGRSYYRTGDVIVAERDRRRRRNAVPKNAVRSVPQAQ